MIYIYDFEDGLQSILAYIIDLPTKIRYWDRRGFPSDIVSSTVDKNIVIMSKPYDCLQRGVNRGKYKDTDERTLSDWSRRNWRYSNPELYDHINNMIENMSNILIIHPDDFINGNLRKKLKEHIGIDIKLSNLKLKQLYNENVNIK